MPKRYGTNDTLHGVDRQSLTEIVNIWERSIYALFGGHEKCIDCFASWNEQSVAKRIVDNSAELTLTLRVWLPGLKEGQLVFSYIKRRRIFLRRCGLKYSLGQHCQIISSGAYFTLICAFSQLEKQLVDRR
jgi:hypothetical protein